jgi:tetratricopeptide (TPR) repeat protein
MDQGEEALHVLVPLQNSRTVEPLLSNWMLLLSETFSRAGDYETALMVLGILAERHPDSAQVDRNRGKIYFNMGDYEKARDHLKRSLERQPLDNAATQFTLGKTLLQLGDAEGAKEAHLQAVNQAPNNYEYLWKLGAVCLSLGEYRNAIEYLERAKPAAEEFPEVYYVLARAYGSVKEREKAADNFRQFQSISARKRQEQYRDVQGRQLIGRGEDALEHGDRVKAKEFFLQALEQQPDSWTAHGYLAEIYLGQGALYQSYEHLVKMQEIVPDSATGQYLLARYWYERRDYQQALVYAERVKEVRPSNPRLRNLLGNIYLALDRIPRAVKEYSLAVEFEPDRPEFKLNLEAAKKRLK